MAMELLNTPGRIERIGHRGAPREFDENTIEGFLRAIERGADAVELDVHTTRDGSVVVHHDPDVALAGGPRTPIGDLSLGEIEAVALPRGGRVPTLAAVMDAVGDRAMVYVEIKAVEAGEAAVAVAGEHGSRYAFHGFDHGAVLRLRDLWPSLTYGVLLDRGTPDAAARARAAPVRDIWAHWSVITLELVAAVHADDQRLVAWTVNDAATALRLTGWGVDGLCTDDVRLLADLSDATG